MYHFGWSHPNRQILPREGMVMQLPSGVSYSVTLTGEFVPLPPPPQYIIFQGTERTNQLYSGWNLVSASLIDPRRTRLVISYNKSFQAFTAHHFDDLDNNWLPFLPREGAVWLYATSTPAPPEGTFSSTNTALYFNNYAPAYGIDERFRGADCETITNGTAQVFRRIHGVTEAVGAAVAISSEFPGYIDPTADLVRYVPRGSSYSVRVQSESGFGETQAATAPDFGSIPPIWPQPMVIFSPQYAFRSQPQDANARPGATVELSAIFHYVNTLDPRVTLDVPYQWQMQNGSTWIDLPNATNATLRLENIDSADAGAYRLRALACDEYFSRTATVSLIAPLVASQLQASGKVRLQVALPVTTKAVVQSSTDLEHWTDSITIDTATNEWTGEVDLKVGARFYRVVEVP
jgi:hypothetical protein